MKNVRFLELLAALFIIFKLTNIIDWPWFFVLIPLLIDMSLKVIAIVYLYIKKTKI
jgi:hypothetical protein